MKQDRFTDVLVINIERCISNNISNGDILNAFFKQDHRTLTKIVMFRCNSYCRLSFFFANSVHFIEIHLFIKKCKGNALILTIFH